MSTAPSKTPKTATRAAWCDHCKQVTRHEWGEKRKPCRVCGRHAKAYEHNTRAFFLRRIEDILCRLPNSDVCAFYDAVQVIAGAADMATEEVCDGSKWVGGLRGVLEKEFMLSLDSIDDSAISMHKLRAANLAEANR